MATLTIHNIPVKVIKLLEITAKQLGIPFETYLQDIIDREIMSIKPKKK